ncbi:MAG: DNA repair protein RecO [Bacteroidetes bacterium]|nr:DNA repair protein RecO [Bacteroidota bacterium]
MLEKTKGIILNNINYRDSSVISHIYTLHFGRQSYILHGVRTQKGAIRPSHILPLSLVDLVVYNKSNTDIQQIRELRCDPVLQTIHFNLRKNSISLFVAEVLSKVLKEESSNPELFQFLTHFIHILDLEKGRIANYPVYLLIQLTKYLGVYPKGNYTEGDVFDLEEGVFTSVIHPRLQQLDKEESAWWWKMVNSNLEEWSEAEVPSAVRANLMDHLLRYYEIHGLHGDKIKSHLVLREVLR